MARGLSVVETIRAVDLERDGEALLSLLKGYACDPMGGGKPLPDTVQQTLIEQLQHRHDYVGIIAFRNDKSAGLINAFEGFSTFLAKPLMNIHDIVVAEEFRGCGLSQRLMEELEKIARERGCCKLTLEVLSNNYVAQSAYKKFGFAAYELDPEAGQALFWQKHL